MVVLISSPLFCFLLVPFFLFVTSFILETYLSFFNLFNLKKFLYSYWNIFDLQCCACFILFSHITCLTGPDLGCCTQNLQSLLRHAPSFSCSMWDLVP